MQQVDTQRPQANKQNYRLGQCSVQHNTDT